MRYLLALLLLSSSCFGATRYVATTGNDTTGDGTAGNPYLTVQRAVDLAVAGDTIMIEAGVYPETVRTERSGTSENRITINGQGVAQINQIYFSHSYITLINATVRSTQPAFGRIMWLRRNANHVVVSNCLVHPNSSLGVTAIQYESPVEKPFGNAAAHSLLVSNTITGVLGSTALSMMGDHGVFRGNRVHDIGQADFVRLWGQGNLISGNIFTNNYAVPGVGNHIDFIQTFGNSGFGSWGHVIEQNRVMDIDAGQLTQLEGNGVPSIGNWTFRNNLFSDIALGASCTIPSNTYSHNVFVRCNFSGGAALNFGTRLYTIDTVTITNRAHGTRVWGNAFVDCGDTNNNTQGWYVFGTELLNVSADFNFVAGANNGAKRVSDTSQGVGHPSGWNFQRWYETNGINGGDPVFLSKVNLDFRLLTGSPLIDAGPTGFASEDFFGTSRPLGGGTDIGYHESDGEPPVDPDPVDPPDETDPEDPPPNPEPPGNLRRVTTRILNVNNIIHIP